MELNTEKIERIKTEAARTGKVIDAVIIGGLPHCRICETVEDCQFATSLGQGRSIHCVRSSEAASGKIYCCQTLSYKSIS